LGHPVYAGNLVENHQWIFYNNKRLYINEWSKLKYLKFGKIHLGSRCSLYISIVICITLWSPEVIFAYIIWLHFSHLEKLYPVYY
jgi:hypothetical protein